MHHALSEALAEMERLYNDEGEAAAEAYASGRSEEIPQWTDELVSFMAALNGDCDNLIPPDVARKAVRETRIWLARLHAAERDVRGLKAIAETNRAAYASSSGLLLCASLTQRVRTRFCWKSTRKGGMTRATARNAGR